MQDRALYSIQEARKLLGGISRNTIYRLLRTGRARQRRHWLPALHFPRCDCRARRQVDYDRQPVASLDTIAPDGPSGSPLATTYLTSKPDCTGSELISCTVAPVCLRHDTLGTRHP